MKSRLARRTSLLLLCRATEIEDTSTLEGRQCSSSARCRRERARTLFAALAVLALLLLAGGTQAQQTRTVGRSSFRITETRINGEWVPTRVLLDHRLIARNPLGGGHDGEPAPEEVLARLRDETFFKRISSPPTANWSWFKRDVIQNPDTGFWVTVGGGTANATGLTDKLLEELERAVSGKVTPTSPAVATAFQVWAAVSLGSRYLHDMCFVSGHRGVQIEMNGMVLPQAVKLGNVEWGPMNVGGVSVPGVIKMDHDAVELWSKYANRASLYAWYLTSLAPEAALAAPFVYLEVQKQRLVMKTACAVGGHHGAAFVPVTAGLGVSFVPLGESNTPKPRPPSPTPFPGPPSPPAAPPTLAVTPREAFTSGTNMTFVVNAPSFANTENTHLVFWVAPATNPSDRKIIGGVIVKPDGNGSFTWTCNTKDKGDVGTGTNLFSVSVEGVDSNQVPVEVRKGQFALTVSPGEVRLEPGDQLEFRVDTSEFLNEDIELIFRIHQNTDPTDREIFRVPNTRGEREVIERRNIRETPANSGTVTFSVQASNLRQAHTGELTKTAQVRVIKPGTPVFDVQPRVASVSKNTQLMFRIHSPTHDKPGNPATYRFFMRQDTNPQEATVGGFITDKGEAVRYWGIQSETPANLGVVRFYATVGDFTVGPIYVTVTP